MSKQTTPLKAPLSFKVGDKVQTPEGPGVIENVDEYDPTFPYLVRLDALWFGADDVRPPTSFREKATLTLEFDSADDRTLAQGILGNLYAHGALDKDNFPALTRVIERLRTAKGDSAAARVAYTGIDWLPIHVTAGYHEHDGKLCEKT